ncbi:MAG: DUF2924 domain-containing protein [Pirellulaceae bacterium]
MKTSVQMQLAKLAEMSTGELAQRYTELFGEPTRTRHKAYLIRKIAWRLQALAEGDLSERAKRRAAELANDADVRLTSPRVKGEQSGVPAMLHVAGATDPRLPAPGGAIVRQYKGRAVRVLVTEDGFEFDGERYRSLSAVAKAISGSHCNGFRFFGLEARP